jgi:3-oxoacyl-[acyl-carrier-protein] synthase I
MGFDTDQNFNNALAGTSGITEIEDLEIFPKAFYGAKIKFDTEELTQYTYLEQLFIKSIADVLSQVDGLDKSRTILIVSSTKGNIDLLDPEKSKLYKGNRIELHTMAQVISDHFNLMHSPVVVSNACISGVSAILTAQKLIRMGQYDHAIVTGGDILSEFTVSGFQSLMAISDEPCRPYDEARKGITLGEAVGTMLISNDESLGNAKVEIKGGAQSNDANHISGPSRTGEGLKLAVEKALNQASFKSTDIDYINAHGTATIYNDEMEAIAFDRLNLSKVPMNSLKGYFGHTLGAAGIIESIMTIRQLISGKILESKGFTKIGVTKPLNVMQSAMTLDKADIALKTVSGFGGCNAAIIYKRL